MAGDGMTTEVRHDPREVVLEMPAESNGHEFMSPWGPIGNAPQMCAAELVNANPIILVMPDDLGACARPGGYTTDGLLGVVDQTGKLTILTPERDRTLIYELFPARWSDDEGPAIYVGRWPD